MPSKDGGRKTVKHYKTMNENLPAVVQPEGQGGLLAVIDRAARDNTVDVAKMEKLLDLAERVHARQAEAAYDAAMNAAQSEMRPIATDSHNPQTRSRYASYGALDKAVRPIYSMHGFSLSFGTKATGQDKVIVTCRVSHRAGHTERVEIEMPADGKGAKGGDVMTKTHATGSAVSYGMRYLLKMIFNLAIGEYDDDGNAAGGKRQFNQAGGTMHASTTSQARSVMPTKRTEAPMQSVGVKPGNIVAEGPNPPQQSPEPAKASKVDTMKCKLRFLDLVKGNKLAAWTWAVQNGWIMPNEKLEDASEFKFPTTKEQFDGIVNSILELESGGIPQSDRDLFEKAYAEDQIPGAEMPEAPKPEIELPEGTHRIVCRYDMIYFEEGRKRDGTKWQKWAVPIKDQSGKAIWYSTFSSTIAEMLKAHKDKEVELYFTTDSKGYHTVVYVKETQ